MTREEAIAVIRKNYPHVSFSGTEFETALRELIPELAESEDERIRKWLYDYVFNCPNGNFAFYGGVGKQAVLAWLEKQKEQKPPIAGNDFGWIDELKHDLEHPEELDQKVDDVLKQRKGMSLEWCEVELEFRGEMVKVKRPFYRDDKGRGYSTTEQDEIVAWNALRAWCEKKGVSLYDLYPNTEWSEEDERMLTDISWAIRHCAYDDKKKERVMKWFNDDYRKFLRPSWKPSEEQMKMLLNVEGVLRAAQYTRQAKFIAELYEQLKKL